MVSGAIGLGLVTLSLAIWVVLVGFWGRFWWADQRLDAAAPALAPAVDQGKNSPSVWAIIPARNEADVLPQTLGSLLRQDYPGVYAIVLVDDQSTDGTATVARQVAQQANQTERLTVIAGEPLAPGWTGKLWAMDQGARYAQGQPHPPDYLLFSDADIEHSPSNLRQLVAKAEAEALDLTSLMVLLRCESHWEKLLIPAFVFFFQLLYPFPWVNDPARSTAAAAGGCILLRRQALERIGGLTILRNALIDDCSLAAAVKRSQPPKATLPSPSQEEKAASPHPPIWLGLTTTTHSLRPYPTLGSIWDMVARTAYTQLHYSPWLLIGTVLGMGLVYLVPPIELIWGIATEQGLVAILAGLTWLLMALAYGPTLRLYRCSPLLGFALPLIGLLYTLMTLDSAWRHWRGQGGAWKGRVYPTEI
ncbi:glycosyltransferase [Nodosilinea nodulosa]|uniref:glycosyltransferase n=1 Tax=Nodosilinea nodulosa TaxID=416001 RepID=UPI0002E4734C|nr:glycosyltransferase [Nodosilinea nodulosa]